MPLMTLKYFGKIAIILFPLLLLIFQVSPRLTRAGNHAKGDRHFGKYESRDEYYGNNHHTNKWTGKDEEGHEATGQTAAWLLVAANLTVMLSIIIKGVSRYIPLGLETKNTIKRFNQFQKIHLMRFHYLLNPLALCTAFLHFLLSSCRRSPLPEWGLLFVAMVVFLGLMVKFKVTPKWMRRPVHRLHTSTVTFSALILVLVVGHLIVD